MPVVTNTVTLPDGTAAQYASVVIRLVANAAVGTEAPGYSGTTEVLGTTVPAVSSAGVWSVTLTANSTLVPAGTVYQITTQIPGRPSVVEYVSVPNGAGPYSVANILTSAPSSITPTELAAHLADTTDAHGFYSGSGSPEAVVTAAIGAGYRDTTNGNLYVKRTGAGNTGWVVIPVGTEVPTLTELFASSFFITAVSTTYSFPLFVAPFPLTIKAAGLAIAVGFARSDTDYWEVQLRRMRANVTTTIATQNTKVTGGVLWDGNTGWTLDSATFDPTNQLFNKDDILNVAFFKTGNPINLDRVGVTVRYEPR